MADEIIAYVTKAELLRIREYEKDGFEFNRALTDEYIARLDPELRLPVVRVWVHKQYRGPFPNVMRCLLCYPKTGQYSEDPQDFVNGHIDMPVEEYLTLPVAEI